MRRRSKPPEQARIFSIVLQHWQSLATEQEKATFMLACFGDDRLGGLVPFMVESALLRLGSAEAAARGGSKDKKTPEFISRITREFWDAISTWEKDHPGAAGLKDAQRAWRYAVGEVALRIGTDPRTVKRRLPDPLKRFEARSRALAQALREPSAKK